MAGKSMIAITSMITTMIMSIVITRITTTNEPGQAPSACKSDPAGRRLQLFRRSRGGDRGGCRQRRGKRGTLDRRRAGILDRAHGRAGSFFLHLFFQSRAFERNSGTE